MHIGFLAMDYPSAGAGGGVGSQVRVLAQALVEAGHKVTVVALGRRKTSGVEDRVRVHRVAPGNLHWYLSRIPLLDRLLVTAIRELEYSKAIWSAVRRLHAAEAFDILEATETGALGVACAGPRIPLIIRLHGDPYTFYKHTPSMRVTPALRLSRRLQRIALRRAALLISPSQHHRHEISEELRQHPPIEVTPNAIADVATRPETTTLSAPIRALLSSEDPIILYIGRIEKCKGIPQLLSAAALVRRSVPNCRFVLAGAPHPSLPPSELDAQVRDLGLQQAVHFLGHVAHEQLPAIFARAVATVAPSYYETFGLAALESMSHGVPVVASAAGALPELVIDRVTGCLVPSHEASDLASAITELLLDSSFRMQLSRNARLFADQFHIRHQIRRNVELYQSVCTSGQFTADEKSGLRAIEGA
jgi:glycosyltransferase involved in cell wall biosynthesis